MRALFTIFCLISIAHASGSFPRTTIYRVVEANPFDFVNALKTVNEGSHPGQSGVSRLQKYVKITRKKISSSNIEMRVEIQNRLLPSAFTKYAALNLKLKQLDEVATHPRFDVQFIFSDSATVTSLLTISPYRNGSLLKLDIRGTTLPPWMLQRALDLMLKLNLASSAPANNM